MAKNDSKLIIFVPFLAILFYTIHKYVLENLQIDTSTFYYKLSTLYSTFCIFSILIILILIVIKTKNLDIVGMSFLILTSIKMVLSYIMVRPILSMHPSEMSLQKTNFFGIFILFLAIETIITIRILNNK
jgi:hypothetical protein